MRNKGSKDKHGRFYSVPQLEKKALKIVAELDIFWDKTYKNPTYRPLTNYDLINALMEHLKEVAAMKKV